ncbi:MAG: hypothetical protein JXK94_13550 [Deltaproteobacteria bacterium]|nr:hypothetical protein [Deltaproteobacteria bacterium]
MSIILLLVVLIGVHIFLSRNMWQHRAEVRQTTKAGYVLPSKYSRVLAVGNKGLLADFLFLKTTTFYGERVVHKQNLSEEDWEYVLSGLESVTDLDPYFQDPYIFAEGILTWGVGKIDEANQFLKKGMKYRTHDWRLPYYLGFNHFYFKKDLPKGADYLMQASRLPNSPNFLPKLAARLGYYGDRAKTAILFLKGMILETQDEGVRKFLLKRQTALERASWIEEQIVKFKAEQFRPPANLGELVIFGYVDLFPEDPYGGQWMIMPNGRVFSTSKFVEPQRKKDQDTNPERKK